MSTQELKSTIRDMVVVGKGILAADESVKTATKRLASIGTESTEETRRQYRNLILTAPGLEKYKKFGCRFAKWRAVYHITENTPTEMAIKRNAEDLAKYAKICQEHGIVPIVEPEVLIDGTHSIDTCYKVTEKVLKEVFAALKKENVMINYTILKPSMVISGKEASNRADVDEVAGKTIKCLKATVPAELPSINFLSGGQTPQEATAHLNMMHTLGENLPWYVSFSYARALQDPALKTWRGKKENFDAGQRAFIKRAKLNSLATMGKYEESMENNNLDMVADRKST